MYGGLAEGDMLLSADQKGEGLTYIKSKLFV